MLRANNLTICVPNKGCDKHCPYCISEMTPRYEIDKALMYKNAEKVKRIAEVAGVTSVLFTGKGEPLLNFDFVGDFSKLFSNFPLEVQTNGKLLLVHHEEFPKSLASYGINVVAISMDNRSQFKQYRPLFEELKKNKLIVRITVNVTSMLDKYSSFPLLLDYCHKHHISQLTIRHIVVPTTYNEESKHVVEWIKKHTNEQMYDAIVHDANNLLKKSGKIIQVTTDGTQMWDLEGVSYTHIDYCIQEQNQSNDLRSLIFNEDGHLYTSWNSPASVLF